MQCIRYNFDYLCLLTLFHRPVKRTAFTAEWVHVDAIYLAGSLPVILFSYFNFLSLYDPSFTYQASHSPFLRYHF